MLNSTDAINARYGGAVPATTRVYASDGSDDPWQVRKRPRLKQGRNYEL